MASSQPIIRQVRFLSLIPQLIIMGLFILIYYWLSVSDPILYGVFTYLLISIVIRNAIPRHHRKGIRLYQNKEYEKAIAEFQKSYDFFTKNNWIDKYRFLVLLSSSKISYLEMSIINMAFCYSQLGEGSKSRELYKKALSMFPNSQIAESALKMLDSTKEIDKN